MSKLNGKKLQAATMHQNIFFPNVGEIKKELTNVDSGLNKAVDMVIDEPFILVTTKNKANKPVIIPVPITNFTHMVLADE